MRVTDPKYRLLLFMGIWFFVNLLQAGLTELNPDEPYYWSYSKEPAWGYYDHPPGIALIIRIGSMLLPGEAGVRFISVLLSTLTILVLWLLVDRPEKPEQLNTLFLLFLAMPFLQVYAFIATPDGPLLFLTALFFLLYKYFLEKEGAWWVVFAWGACMTAMLYSKYHGILVIGFTVLSNLRLFRMPRFYIAAIFGALLFTPHIYWQFSNDFPSLRYHLLGRNNPFELKDLIYYLLNQLVIFNPFLFPFLIIALVRQTKGDFFPQPTLKRSFLFLIYGFWLFFLLMLPRGHVEPHWLATSSIAFIALTYYYSLSHDKFRRRMNRMILFSLVPIFLFRLAILDGVLEKQLKLFHERNWVYQLEKEAGNTPVLFLNDFREPSMYNFYTGNEAYNLTNIRATRQSQYRLWDWEKALQGRRVALLGLTYYWPCKDCSEIELKRRNQYLKFVDDFQVSQQVHFRILETTNEWAANSEQSITVEIFNPYEHSIEFGTGEMPLQPVALFYGENDSWEIVPIRFSADLKTIPSRQAIEQDLTLTVPAGLEGIIRFGIGIRTGDIPPVWQSDMLEIQISPPEN